MINFVVQAGTKSKVHNIFESFNHEQQRKVCTSFGVQLLAMFHWPLVGIVSVSGEVDGRVAGVEPDGDRPVVEVEVAVLPVLPVGVVDDRVVALALGGRDLGAVDVVGAAAQLQVGVPVRGEEPRAPAAPRKSKQG